MASSAERKRVAAFVLCKLRGYHRQKSEVWYSDFVNGEGAYDTCMDCGLRELANVRMNSDNNSIQDVPSDDGTYIIWNC